MQIPRAEQVYLMIIQSCENILEIPYPMRSMFETKLPEV